MVPDLLFDGIRSINGRYFVPANIAMILVAANFLVNTQNNTIYNKKLLACLLPVVSIFSNINILLSESWWNKELGRVNSEFIHVIDKDQTLLIVSGSHPTNLRDILLLGFEVDSDVHFRLYENLDGTENLHQYQNVYWFPSSFEEVQANNEKEKIQITEMLSGVLWRIDGKK